jgi:hypothetical protein
MASDETKAGVSKPRDWTCIVSVGLALVVVIAIVWVVYEATQKATGN